MEGSIVTLRFAATLRYLTERATQRGKTLLWKEKLPRFPEGTHVTEQVEVGEQY